MRVKTKTILSTLFFALLVGISVNGQDQKQQPQVYEITAKDAVDIAGAEISVWPSGSG